jgi:hypothetical protein
VHFTNNKRGISVATDPDGKEVRSIEYFPAKSDASLRCPEAAQRQSEIESGESEYRSRDVGYSSESVTERRIRLDYFADRLREHLADSRIYLIAYAGQRARVGEAYTRANQAKVYLIGKKGIKPNRIVIVNGGHRDPPGVDLYIVPRGQPKPLSSPNIYPGNVILTRR